MNRVHEERLVSHIRGEGVDVTALLPRCHETNATGWARRLRHGISNMVEKLVSINNGDVPELKRLLSIINSHQDRSTKRQKWGKVSIQKLAGIMEHDDRRQRIANGRIEILKGSQRELFLALVKLDSAIVLDSAGETDEVVTIDTKRQIRFLLLFTVSVDYASQIFLLIDLSHIEKIALTH